MRAAPLFAIAVSALWSDAALSESNVVSPQLAAVEGVRLFVTPYGEKPCDFVQNRLLADMEFTLNTAGIDFIEGPGDGSLTWPILEAVVTSMTTSGGCVWSLKLTLSTRITGGTALARPYDGYVDIWERGVMGVHPGSGLTAYVSEPLQADVRDLVNDIFASRKLYAAQ